MRKSIKLLAMLVAFIVIAVLVYAAGRSALLGSPLIALIPVVIILTTIVLYIRLSDKHD